MELPTIPNNPPSTFPPQRKPIKHPNTPFPIKIFTPKTHFKLKNHKINNNLEISVPDTKLKQKINMKQTSPYNPELSRMPTMSEIMGSSRAQNLEVEIKKFGPFFRIVAKSLETKNEVGRAEGVIRVWFGGKILHLDSMKLQKETIGMKKSIFGIGLFIGAVAIRYGYDCGCTKAELLAINDTHLYHSKLVKFYKRLGFKEVYEVTGSSLGDVSHMLVWGGVGTRMDANLEHLIIKWCSRFKSSKTA